MSVPQSWLQRTSWTCILLNSSLVLPANMGPRMRSIRPLVAGSSKLSGASASGKGARGAFCGAAGTRHSNERSTAPKLVYMAALAQLKAAHGSAPGQTSCKRSSGIHCE